VWVVGSLSSVLCMARTGAGQGVWSTCRPRLVDRLPGYLSRADGFGVPASRGAQCLVGEQICAGNGWVCVVAPGAGKSGTSRGVEACSACILRWHSLTEMRSNVFAFADAKADAYIHL